MKDFKTKEELIEALKASLNEENPFDKYTLDRLSSPSKLIREFKEKPLLRLMNRRGDWFFIWKNQTIKIDEEWVSVEGLLNRLSEFLTIEAANNASEAVNYVIEHVGDVYINRDILPEIKEIVEKTRNGNLSHGLELRKFNAHPEGGSSENDVLLMDAVANGRAQALQAWLTDLIESIE